MSDTSWLGRQFQTFLFTCAGADRSLLHEQPCDTERFKYAGIGATVLLTALVAFVSGAYALFTVFHDRRIAYGAGFLWLLIVFNLDRIFVSSVKTNASSSKLWSRAALALRLILAVALGIVVSIPLELLLFEQEINSRLLADKKQVQEADAQQQQKRRAREWEDEGGSQEITKLETDIEKIRARLGQLDEDRRRTYEEIVKEEREPGARGGESAPGPSPWRLRASVLDREIEALVKSLNEADQRRRELVDRKITELGKGDKAEPSDDIQAVMTMSFLARLTTLRQLASTDLTIRLATLFIALIFVIVEMAPIIVKMVSADGPYEVLLKKKEVMAVYTTGRFLEERSAKLELDRGRSQMNDMSELIAGLLGNRKDLEISVMRIRQDYLKGQNRHREALETRIGLSLPSDVSVASGRGDDEFEKLCDEYIADYQGMAEKVIQEANRRISKFNSNGHEQ